MLLEEYEGFFQDPSDFWLKIYLPRIFGAFEGFRHLPPLTDIIEIPTGQPMALAQSQVLDTLQKMINAGKDLQKGNAIMAQSMVSGAASGYPLTMGMLNFAPFDAIGDTLRETKSIMMDMFRNGDKLLKAVDIMTDIIIHSILHNPMLYDAVTVGFPLHKGANGWMSPKHQQGQQNDDPDKQGHRLSVQIHGIFRGIRKAISDCSHRCRLAAAALGGRQRRGEVQIFDQSQPRN